MGPARVQRTPHKLDGLISQARSVRGHVSRRAMHASGDSPWHSSAKHHILEACFFRMTPFRSMLLTVQSGLHSLAPRAQSVPAYAQVLRHSSITLSRRTRIPTQQKCRSTGPGAKKSLDPQRPEKKWVPDGASGHELSRPKRVSWLQAYGRMSAMSIPVSCVGVKTHVFMNDLVVAQEASAVECSSRLDFLLLHNLGTNFVAP